MELDQPRRPLNQLMLGRVGRESLPQKFDALPNDAPLQRILRMRNGISLCASYSTTPRCLKKKSIMMFGFLSSFWASCFRTCGTRQTTSTPLALQTCSINWA